jgi:DNA-binding CsgD family transcriptional regulator
MPNDTTDSFSLASSARSLRANIKQSQANDAYLRVYLQLGQQLFNDGWQSHTALSLLQALCGLLSAEHAVLAIEQSGKLLVQCQIGLSMPVGSRIPMMGSLATVLKNPVQFALHENKKTSLWTHGDTDQHDCIVPIALGHHGQGLMAFSGKKLLLNPSEIDALQTCAGMLGLAMAQHQGPVRSEADLSVLATLTPREREILAMLPAGLSNNELAAKLGIASGTAKIHVERVLNKLGVKDRTKAAVKAIELGYKSS